MKKTKSIFIIIFLVLCFVIACPFIYKFTCIGLARLYFEQSKFEKAEQKALKVIEADPDCVDAIWLYTSSWYWTNLIQTPMTSETPKYITFGSYEQDGNIDNGKEPIEWQIIYEDDSKMLLLSRYVLDNITYHDEISCEITWEECYLRKWLNNEFLNNSFSDEEIERIITTKNINCGNMFFDNTTGGKKTEDRIFCLSLDDIFKYYQLGNLDIPNSDSGNSYFTIKDNLLIAEMTNYSKRYDVFHEGYGSWVLRTPGNYNFLVCVVDAEGKIDTTVPACSYYYGIRPAMYIKK